MTARSLLVRSRLGPLVTSEVIDYQLFPVRSRLANTVENATDIVPGKIRRFIVKRGETIVALIVDRKNRVYMTGGFTAYIDGAERFSRAGEWKPTKKYHRWEPPKFIGHLQDVINEVPECSRCGIRRFECIGCAS